MMLLSCNIVVTLKHCELVTIGDITDWFILQRHQAFEVLQCIHGLHVTFLLLYTTLLKHCKMTRIGWHHIVLRCYQAVSLVARRLCVLVTLLRFCETGHNDHMVPSGRWCHRSIGNTSMSHQAIAVSLCGMLMISCFTIQSRP